MHYEYFTANDNTTLAYQTSIPLNPPPASSTTTTTDSHSSPSTSPKPCILLIHGFSGSSAYFTKNTPFLSSHSWILASDLRGHGNSRKTTHGHHVARLATDLQNLVDHIRKSYPDTHIYAVGCSIGAAVLWTYIELFTDIAFSGFVFVDQAPLQNRSVFDDWDERFAHYGCFDERTMIAAQHAWGSQDAAVREETYRGLVEGCLGYRYAPNSSDNISAEQRQQDEEFFMSVSRTCDGRWLARLLGDHTGYDHREGLERISKPVLVLAGRRSGCFSLDGMMEVVKRVQNGGGVAKGVVFESGHWLFWEESDRFNEVLLGWVRECEEQLT